MKNLTTLSFLTVFTLFVFSNVYAQRSPLIGSWDLTIKMDDDQLKNLGMLRHGLAESDGFPGWLKVKQSGFSTLVGYYVGYEGSARPYLPNGDVMTMLEDYTGGNIYAKMPEYGHQHAWTQAIKAGFNSPEHKALTSSFDYAGPLNETVLMGNLAIRSYSLVNADKEGRRNYYGRKKLLWDGENMKITNFEAANQFVGRTYREGWKLI